MFVLSDYLTPYAYQVAYEVAMFISIVVGLHLAFVNIYALADPKCRYIDSKFRLN